MTVLLAAAWWLDLASSATLAFCALVRFEEQR